MEKAAKADIVEKIDIVAPHKRDASEIVEIGVAGVAGVDGLVDSDGTGQSLAVVCVVFVVFFDALAVLLGSDVVDAPLLS